MNTAHAIRHPKSRFFTFAPRELAVLFSILIVLPILTYIVFQREFYDWYLQVFVKPRLEKELGFKAAWVPYTDAKGEKYEAFVITEVSPGGVFETAGFRPGDMPRGHMHGVEAPFYGALEYSRDHGPVEIVVVPFRPGDNHTPAARRIRVHAGRSRSN